jgi:protein-arginine kinase activator protein McsA
LDYDSSQLENFHLLNSVPFKSIKLKDPIVDNTKKLEELEVELNIAVKNNNFEKASEIRDKIKKLKK